TWIPGSAEWQLSSKQVGVRPADLAPNTVSVSHQAANFQRRKAIEVRADFDRLPLDLRMQRGGVFGRLDHLGNRGEDEAGRVLERLGLELPHPIHDDVGRT